MRALDPALAFGFGDPTFDPFEAERDIFADRGKGVVALEEMLATAGKPGSRRYVIERDSQVHPLTTARIGYEFPLSVEI